MSRWIAIDRRTVDVAELTDERLDMLAERYESRCVRNLTGAAFVSYVGAPAYYDAVVDELVRGCGLQGDASHPATWRVLEPTVTNRLSLYMASVRGWIRGIFAAEEAA